MWIIYSLKDDIVNAGDTEEIYSTINWMKISIILSTFKNLFDIHFAVCNGLAFDEWEIND